MKMLHGAVFIAALAGGGIRCVAGGGADAIVDRWIESVGGRSHLESVTSYEIHESVNFGMGSPVNHVKFVRTKTGQFRVETSNPVLGTLVQGWDGFIGWESNDRLGAGLIPQADLANLAGQENLLFPLFVERVYKGRRVIGAAEVAGRSCTVMGMTAGGGREEKWYFDDADGRLVRLDQRQPGQPEGWVKTEFLDYRPAAGLVIPFTVRTVNQGATVVLTRESLVVNPPTDAAIFMISTARLVEITGIAGILSRNLAQIGGDAITRIHTRIKTIAIESPDSGIKYTEAIYQKAPNLFLQEISTPGEGLKWEGFDGTVRWSGSELAGFHIQGSAATAQWRKFGNLADEGRQLVRVPLRRMLGARKVRDRAAHAVVLSDFVSEEGTCYFDDENARLLRLTSVFSDGHGQQEATQDFSDFRRIDGVEIPFVTTDTNAAGQSVETIVSLQDNVPIDDGTFKPRRGDW